MDNIRKWRIQGLDQVLSRIEHTELYKKIIHQFHVNKDKYRITKNYYTKEVILIQQISGDTVIPISIYDYKVAESLRDKKFQITDKIRTQVSGTKFKSVYVDEYESGEVIVKVIFNNPEECESFNLFDNFIELK